MPNSFMFSILDLYSAILSIFWQQDFLFFPLPLHVWIRYSFKLQRSFMFIISFDSPPNSNISGEERKTVTLNDLLIFILLFSNHCLSRLSMLSICLKWRKKQEHSMGQHEHRPWGVHPTGKQFPMTINPQYFHIAWSNFPSQLLDRNRPEHVLSLKG